MKIQVKQLTHFHRCILSWFFNFKVTMDVASLACLQASLTKGFTKGQSERLQARVSQVPGDDFGRSQTFGDVNGGKPKVWWCDSIWYYFWILKKCVFLCKKTQHQLQSIHFDFPSREANLNKEEVFRTSGFFGGGFWRKTLIDWWSWWLSVADNDIIMYIKMSYSYFINLYDD